MSATRLRAVALLALITAGCFPDLSGAPCESDLNCPSDQFCQAGACAVGARRERAVALSFSGAADVARASMGGASLQPYSGPRESMVRDS